MITLPGIQALRRQSVGPLSWMELTQTLVAPDVDGGRHQHALYPGEDDENGRMAPCAALHRRRLLPPYGRQRFRRRLRWGYLTLGRRPRTGTTPRPQTESLEESP